MAGGPPFHGLDFSSDNGTMGAPPLRLRSGQALAFFARVGGDTADILRWYDGRAASLLRRSGPALYYLVVLPAATAAALRPEPGLPAGHSRTSAPQVQICGGGVRRNAGACAFARE